MVRRFAFTLIELLVVIAIIAILAAILFPVFARVKESAKQTVAVSQCRQLSASIFMYATDHDDMFAPSTNYGVDVLDPGRVWGPIVFPYVKDEGLFVAPGSDGKMARNWSERGNQSIGYSGATAFDPYGCVEGQPDTAGCEGFTTPANFNAADNASSVALFAVTPNGPVTQKYRGYVFSPYNGPVYLEDPKLSPPLVSDRDLVAELGANLPPSMLKPVFCRYHRTGNDDGLTPIVFADGHTRTYSAKKILSVDGSIVWRFR